MRFGNLTVYTGPMFSGKTNNLIREILFQSYFSSDTPRHLSVYKLAFDVRYASSQIVSHDGRTVDATVIDSGEGLEYDGVDLVFFDEIQFFVEPYFHGNILDIVRQYRMNGVDVFCAGLDLDFMGRAFEITASLMAEASEVHRGKARCSVCGGEATMTSRMDLGSARFELGVEKYSPMCLRHWHEDRLLRCEEEVE